MLKLKQTMVYAIICTALILICTGCSPKYSYIYNDNGKIADTNSFSMQTSSRKLNATSTILTYEVKRFSGCFEVARANVENKTDTELHFTVNANKGKVKLVLVKANSQVEVLKEVIFDKESKYDGTIKVTCNSNDETLKVVGDNFSGTFEISQPDDKPFNFECSYGDYFPFNSHKNKKLGKYSKQHSYYNDNSKIANNNIYNMRNSIQNLDDNKTTLSYKIGNFSGFFKVASTNVENKTDTELHFTVNANKGKIKLVLVKANSQVEVLKEVIFDKESKYDGTIKVTCNSNDETLKVVGDNFSGTFEISQPDDKPFNFEVSNDDDDDDDFPFNFNQKI